MAGALGLPRLVFVLDENAVLPLPQLFLSDPVYGERQRAFRERVLDAGITRQPVDSPERLEMLLFQALTTLQQAAGSHGDRAAEAGGAGQPGVAVRLAPRPVFLAGREELLAGLDARLAAGQGGGPGVAVLSGLGGAGKTSVAVEYAYRQATGLEVVWQLPAEDPAGLMAGFAELAAALGTGGGDVVARVHAVLAQRDDWLLVLDNVPDPAGVAGVVPPAGRGRVVITSQFGFWPGRAVVEVPVLDRAVAAQFVLDRTGAAGSVEEASASVLAGELGGLPLALEQAGAYMQASGRSVGEYLGLFRARRAELLGRGIRPGMTSESPRRGRWRSPRWAGRDQPGLDDRRDDRAGPAVLAQADRAGRRPGRGRAQDAALPRPERCRPPGPRRTPQTLEDPRQLAMGRGDHPGLAADHRPPRPRLTCTNPSLQPAEPIRDLWNPAAPARQPEDCHAQTVEFEVSGTVSGSQLPM